MLEKPRRVAVAGGYETWELLFEISIPDQGEKTVEPQGGLSFLFRLSKLKLA
jgi:hypothetical protein